MCTVTITSDWTNYDYYLPKLIGEISCLQCDTKIINISNSVKPFNIPQACFILKNTYKSFPLESIHLIAVNSEPTQEAGMVIVKYDGHWFVGINDGRFALLLDHIKLNVSTLVYLLPSPTVFSTFMACGLFTRAIDLITQNIVEKELETTVLKLVGSDVPSIFEDKIIGHVVYIDSYGNAITNISKEHFAKGYITWRSNHENDPDFVIFVRGPYLKIYTIHNNYTDVQNGCTVALFNSAGLLELAINSGNFAQIENIDTTAEIMIKFS
ncbi:MAG: SAM-dependent chlorinase/fluorinase [Bacteroidales bacterium]